MNTALPLAQAAIALGGDASAAAAAPLAAGFQTPVGSLELLIGLVGGIGLAAACGFRVFLPLLAAAIAARAGVIPLHQGMDWLASTPALIALSVACLMEVGAYSIPWLDHALDTIAAPAAIVAGGLAATSQISGIDPTLAWIIGLLAGGGTAGIVQGATMLTRGLSLVTTGGLANPVVAVGEHAMSLLTAVLAILAPVIALVMIIAAVALVLARRRTRQGAFMPRRA